MKIILQEDVEKLGAMGDVVEVADGYARNYLLPRGIAVEATKGKLKNLKLKIKKQKRKKEELSKEAQALAEKLSAEKFVFAVKSGENGKLFGSVTSKDIFEKVEEAGYDIDKRKIELDDHIKTLGTHKINVKVYEDVTAELKVKVVEA